MRTLLYGNTYTLTTTMDGGNHGHIEIVMRENLYLKISTTPYITPVDLGGIVTVPLQATKDIMNHIIAQYGLITVPDIKMKKTLQETLETSQPIDVLFKAIDDGVIYASKANTPFNPA